MEVRKYGTDRAETQYRALLALGFRAQQSTTQTRSIILAILPHLPPYPTHINFNAHFRPAKDRRKILINIAAPKYVMKHFFSLRDTLASPFRERFHSYSHLCLVLSMSMLGSYYLLHTMYSNIRKCACLICT